VPPGDGVKPGRRKFLIRVYKRLLRRYGHAGWWPGETPFEICLGAILTQNTSWRNVEKALTALRKQSLLSFGALKSLSQSRIAPIIRSSGCFNIKAKRVRAFVDFLGREFDGRVENMRAEDGGVLREKLLAVDGVGPETADSILLYGVGVPFFVVDAYTRRIFSRLGCLPEGLGYDDAQAFFIRNLPRQVNLYNDYHAQIVVLGKQVCRARPRCSECPLDDLCPKRGLGAN